MMNIRRRTITSNLSGPLLRRYTRLPSAIYLLKKRCITLLDPQSWDDRDDAYDMERFRETENLKTLLALCLSESTDRYHHWRVFSYGMDGVCILFDKNKIVETLGARHEVRKVDIDETNDLMIGRSVAYMKLQDVEDTNLDPVKRLFTKRIPFMDEKEYRFIYINKKNR